MPNFTDAILQHANTTFSTIHAKFLKQIWGDNSTTAKLHNNQCFTDWQNGRYEVYIPTRDSVDYNLEYSRIAIQILPMISNETKHDETYQLAEPIKTPHGKIESELLLIIAPRQHHWGLVRGFKHRNKPGYFTGIFVNASPDIIWKRVLDLITNFFSKRLTGLFRSLGFEDWVWRWALNKDDNMLYYRVLEHFSCVIRQSAFTFIELYRHFIKCIRLVLGEIGVQNVALKAIHVLEGLNHTQLGRVFSQIRASLNIEVNVPRDDKGLKYLEVLQRG
jgi:hypothetical protein